MFGLNWVYGPWKLGLVAIYGIYSGGLFDPGAISWPMRVDIGAVVRDLCFHLPFFLGEISFNIHIVQHRDGRFRAVKP